jgi:hypothetical protein
MKALLTIPDIYTAHIGYTLRYDSTQFDSGLQLHICSLHIWESQVMIV